MTRIEIDPITRIGGHLTVTCDIEPVPDGPGSRVTDAWNTATLFRGFEVLLRGRDPRDCWHVASRICGVCPTPHALNAVKCVESAMGLDKVPNNARLVRNMMEAAQIGYDHILWFYQLNLLDYVDVMAAARESRPTLPSLGRLKKTLTAMIDSGNLGPFADGYWGHPAYLVPPDLGLELLQHYLGALDVQAKANRAAAALGGKFPMIMNYAPGGLTHLPGVPEILDYQTAMSEVGDFIDAVMSPDMLALASVYGNELVAGGTGGRANYLSWGVLDAESQDPYDRVFPRGAIFQGDFRAVRTDPTQVRIYTARSFYSDATGRGKHPLDAGQEPLEFTGLDDLGGKYDWTQAARLGPDDLPMETGPLAQILIAYMSGRSDVMHLVDRTLDSLAALGISRARSPYVQPGAKESDEDRLSVFESDLGRIVARVLKAKVNADRAVQWADMLLESVSGRDRQYFAPRPIPDAGEGVGGWDAPRGALCHWIRIDDGKVSSYAAVPPSNWNMSPRDDAGVRGPVEQTLLGRVLLDPDRPLEVLRVIHGFDPCMACAVHVLEARARCG